MNYHMRPAPTTLTPSEALTIVPWPDSVLDAVGHHPCSNYVETFWLGILGPSTTFLLRHLAIGLDAEPDGFELSMALTATRLGLGDKLSPHGPFVRTFTRLVQFQLATEAVGPGVDGPTLAVRRRMPPLSRRQVIRLPELLQAAHLTWEQHLGDIPHAEQLRRRCRQLALSYLEAGLERDEAERQLHRLNYHPAIAYEAAEWAADRYELALASSVTVTVPIQAAGDAA